MGIHQEKTAYVNFLSALGLDRVRPFTYTWTRTQLDEASFDRCVQQCGLHEEQAHWYPDYAANRLNEQASSLSSRISSVESLNTCAHDALWRKSTAITVGWLLVSQQRNKEVSHP